MWWGWRKARKADTITPAVGDYVQVQSDSDGIDAAPFTARILEADGWTCWMDASGDHTYTLKPKNLLSIKPMKSGGNLWTFSKDDMGEGDLDTGGRLQPDQGTKFKRKKPPIPKEA